MMPNMFIYILCQFIPFKYTVHQKCFLFVTFFVPDILFQRAAASILPSIIEPIVNSTCYMYFWVGRKLCMRMSQYCMNIGCEIHRRCYQKTNGKFEEQVCALSDPSDQDTPVFHIHSIPWFPTHHAICYGFPMFALSLKL